ncbi:MAG: cation:proton antiporter [Calditrichaeota bacterium]|nr:cation:proton antiporter [Calditrichota bacterium]
MEVSFIRLSTLVFALFFGVSLFVVARHMRIPAIAPLLIGGIILGPELSGLIDSYSLGQGLNILISICVATILFEGGLTLHPDGFSKAGGVIARLLSIGVLITWLGTAVILYFVLDLPPAICLLSGSLIIVTGPTVITPLLQRLKINDKLHQILHWESVLIDPIGVFITILVFEWISIDTTLTQHIMQFSMRVVIGVSLGTAGGFTIYYLLKKNLIPEEQINIFVLAAALFFFAVSDFFLHEAGLLTVVVAGLIIGWKKPVDLKKIQQFKGELTEMAIGILFILLAAKLELENFIELGWQGLISLAIIIFLIRPLGIFLSTLKSDLKLNEKVFLGWLAPRGVVAGSMASLFTIQLTEKGFEYAAFLEAFTFSIIGATVVIQGSLSGTVARVLKVKAPPKKGWLIIGANYFARRIAEFINHRNQEPSVLIDNNKDAIIEAQKEGLIGYVGDALSVNVVPEDYFNKIGNVLALTDNRDLNELVCEKWSEHVEADHLYRWTPSDSESQTKRKTTGKAIWCDLPKPSQVGYDLNSKEALLSPRKTDRLNRNLLPGVHALVAFQNDELFLEEFKEKSPGELLLFKQLGYHLPLIVKKEHIFLNLKFSNLQDMLNHLFKIVFKDSRVLAVEEALSGFSGNHGNPFFVLGNEVAVPHSHFEKLTDAICIVAQVPDGIQLDKNNNEISRLFFILLNPASTPELHLMLLADIAKIASNAELVNKLLNAVKPSRIFELLKEIPPAS